MFLYCNIVIFSVFFVPKGVNKFPKFLGNAKNNRNSKTGNCIFVQKLEKMCKIRIYLCQVEYLCINFYYMCFTFQLVERIYKNVGEIHSKIVKKKTLFKNCTLFTSLQYKKFPVHIRQTKYST